MNFFNLNYKDIKWKPYIEISYRDPLQRTAAVISNNPGLSSFLSKDLKKYIYISIML